MRLSDLGNNFPLRILRDGDFDSLGLLSHKGNKMLVALYDKRFTDKLVLNKHISCVISTVGFVPEIPDHLSVATCDDPQTVFYQIHQYLLENTDFYWKNFDSEISVDAHVHHRAYVASQNVRIGSNTVIEPHVTILEHSIIGNNVTIRAGVVVGGEGFEPKYIAGRHVIIPHAGGVLIHDGVEIQANTHVVRAVFNGFTVIGADTKIDALVHIAHNVIIGCRCEIIACVLIGGSVTIGNDVFIGPNASVAPEVIIGDGAFVTLGSVVSKDVPAGQKVTGNFAIEHSKFIKFIKSIR